MKPAPTATDEGLATCTWLLFADAAAFMTSSSSLKLKWHPPLSTETEYIPSPLCIHYSSPHALLSAGGGGGGEGGGLKEEALIF